MWRSPVYGNVLDQLVRHNIAQDDSLWRHFQGHFRQFLPTGFGLTNEYENIFNIAACP